MHDQRDGKRPIAPMYVKSLSGLYGSF